MRRLPTTIVAACLLVLATGCCGKKRVVERWNTVTEITERIDTVIVVRGDSIRSVVPLNLIQGFVHVVDHDLARVNIQIDTATGTLTADVIVKDRPVPVYLNRVSRVTSKGRRVDVERSSAVWWRWFLAGVVLGAVIGWGVRSRLV